jgi:hypothetical protein
LSPVKEKLVLKPDNQMTGDPPMFNSILTKNNNIVDENISEEGKIRGDTIESISSGALYSMILRVI